MGSLLSQYTVMQQAAWASRKFYTAQDRRTGQVVYLIEEPASGSTQPYEHPTLPRVQEILAEGEVRWLMGTLPEGDTLEDLRQKGVLTEQDLLSALISVVDGLISLSELDPPVVPSYIDPACIKRDRLGRWTLDYLALAQAPEARMPGGVPLGVHPMGVLLYWVVTGQVARRTRVQVANMQHGVPPALQFIVIKCLGKSYPSLETVKADLERAGSEREFRALVQQIHQQAEKGNVRPLITVRTRSGSPMEPVRMRINSQPPLVPPGPSVASPAMSAAQAGSAVRTAVEERPLQNIPVVPEREAQAKPPATAGPKKMPPGGPYIPADDRPWALPSRPDDGFRKFVVPPPPNPVLQKAARWASLGAVTLVSAALSLAVAIQAGLVPPEYLPAFMRPKTPVMALPGSARAGVQIGSELPPDQPLPTPGRQAAPATGGAEVGRPSTAPPPVASQPSPPRTNPTQPPAQSTPPRQAQPAPPNQEQPAPPPRQSGPEPPGQSQPEPSPPKQAQPDPPPGQAQPAEPAPGPAPAPADPAPADPAPVPADPAPEPEPPAPSKPPLLPPEPGSIAFLDSKLGAMPILIYLDGRPAGYAYMFPQPRAPYMSLGAFNSLFGRNLFWAPADGGRVRIFTSDRSLFTTDFDIAEKRLWLKLTPALQQALGIELQAAVDGEFYFVSKP